MATFTTNLALENRPVELSVPALEGCMHCAQPIYERGEHFCCQGCAAVFQLLRDEGMGRYYELGGGRGAPLGSLANSHDHKWIETLPLEGGRVSLDAQGIHCAACVWLFEKLYARQQGALAIEVNPALGTLRLTFAPAFALRDFVVDIERFGYRLGPALKDRTPARDPLLLRMGICIALAMNAMLFAFAFYAGLSEGPLFRLFHAIEFGLGALSVLVGGSVFIRSAVLALQARVLHLDLPIALGILLAFASSTASFVAHKSATYFDTLTIFIALMLVGRWLQERVLVQNRSELLENDGIDGLLTRRVANGTTTLVRCAEIESGDTLLIAPGDLVPLDAELLDARGTCSLDWINGESTPRELSTGALVPAGSFNAGANAFTVCARTAFAESAVVDLLRATRPTDGDASRATAWWQRLARVYVAAVLVVAAVGFVGWWLGSGDLGRALEVTAGILIVTCPCAFGIATPLAYELTYAGLRRRGLFVRAASFLDRAPDVEQLVFDKTGTLTTGKLTVAEPDTLLELPPDHLQALYNLAARSAHPKSVAVATLLAPHATFEPGVETHERAGEGLSCVRDARTYRLGSAGDELELSVDGVRLATIELHEHLRVDARREIAALSEAGYGVWIVSGDASHRVDGLAAQLGIDKVHTRGAFKPAEKAAFIDQHPRSMMVGDGLNDSLAVERAFCSGTPAIDRPFLPARTDFYFTTAGIAPVALALRAAKALRRVTQRNLHVAIAYNVITVGLAWAGLLSPLVCAVVMPVSSLTIVIATVASLSARSPLWKS